MTLDRLTAAALAARRSPAVSLPQIAAAAGVSTAQLTRRLHRVAARGDCAAAVAAAVRTPAGAGVLAHRAAAPPHLRTAAAVSSAVGCDVAVGCAAWAGRSIRHSAASRARLARLASDDDQFMRRDVAEHPGCPTLLVAGLSQDRSESVAATAARHRSATADVTAAAAVSPKASIRCAAAANEGCPQQILERLAEDRSSSVVAAVCVNPAASPATLERVAGRGDLDTLRAVADSTKSTTELLGWIVSPHGADTFLAKELAATPSCPPELLRKFARSPEPRVCVAAASNPAIDPATLTDMVDYPNWVADYEHDDDDEYDEYYVELKDDEYYAELKYEAASNPVCSPDLLARLAGDNDVGTRLEAARNPSCPPATLQTLAGDSDTEVVARAAANPQHPSGSLERLAASVNPAHRGGVASNPACSTHLLQRLASDSLDEVRHAVAANPATPAAIIDKHLRAVAVTHPATARALKGRGLL